MSHEEYLRQLGAVIEVRGPNIHVNFLETREFRIQRCKAVQIRRLQNEARVGCVLQHREQDQR